MFHKDAYHVDTHPARHIQLCPGGMPAPRAQTFRSSVSPASPVPVTRAEAEVPAHQKASS